MSQNIDALLQGYWIQVDYTDLNSRYKVRYSDTIFSGGLMVEKGKVNFLNGLFSTDLLYSDERLRKDNIFKNLGKSNYNNITNYFITDSIINVQDNYLNQYILIKIKLINKDSLIVVNNKNKLEYIYVHRYYDSLPEITINSIEYYHGVCFGNCQNYRVKIDKNRDFTYEGLNDVKYLGQFEGKIPKEYFNDIWHKINLLNIPLIKDSYSTAITDASTINIRINYNNNKIKDIESYAGAGTTELKWLMITLYNFEDKVKLD